MRILLTTTSFQDTPGPHQDLLASTGFEIIRARGPLPESEVLALVGEIDAILCGDDALTRAVMEKALPRLRVIGKYGIGLDKIDLDAARDLGIPVLFTPGVNHTTVAEHAFTLLLALARNLVDTANSVRAGKWVRHTSRELSGKTLGIVGLGRIGQEIAVRAASFGMKLAATSLVWPDAFAEKYNVVRYPDLDSLLPVSDYLTLHLPLTEESRNCINARTLALLPPGARIINTARGELVDSQSVTDALRSGQLAGYGADVLDQEPPPADHPLLTAPNCILTPHIGSRTHESVIRQATMSLENILLFLDGKPPHARAV